MPMEEVPPHPPRAGPPPAMDPMAETDAMMLAAEHPYCHEEPCEVSRTDFGSTVREGSYVEEDTLGDLPTEEVVESLKSRTRRDEQFSCVSGISAS